MGVGQERDRSVLSFEPIADKFINGRNRISSFRLNFFENFDSFLSFFFLFYVILIALEHDGELFTFNNDELKLEFVAFKNRQQVYGL